MAIKISEVARAAGVSTATVSRTLSQPAKVNEATRLHVMRFVRDLGYEPNRAARSLRTRRADKLLLTVPDLSSGFFAGIVRGAGRAARDAGFALILADTLPAPEHERAHAAMLRSREVDGIIFTAPTMSAELRAIAEAAGPSAPIVSACEYRADFGVCGVHIDDAAAADGVIAHLAGLGHTRIGVITGPLRATTSANRLAGVRAAAARLGLEAGLTVRTAADFTLESGAAFTKDLIAEGVTAIFCFSDEMAIGALSAMRKAGLSCPADLSLVGFDDLRLSRHLHPALTTVAQPAEEMGAKAVDLLLDLILARTSPASGATILPHRLMVRESTAAPPASRSARG